jgi:hypothetical protein
LNVGSLTNDTQPGRLFDFLRAHEGQWHTSWELMRAVDSVAIATVVSAVRMQLPEGWVLDSEPDPAARRRWRYRLRRLCEVQLELV